MFSKTKIKILLSIIALTAFVLSSPEASAQALNFTQNVQIGDTNLSAPITSGSLGAYLQTIYKYAIGAVGILATVVMMFGGVMWITAAGSNERVSSAKAWIGASLTGLVLTLSSYTILYLVNPNTLTFRPIELAKPEEIKNDACSNCVVLSDEPSCTKNECCRWIDSVTDYCESKIDAECGYVPNVNTICKESIPGCLSVMGESPYSANCPPSLTCCQTSTDKKYCGENNEGLCIVCPTTLGVITCLGAVCGEGWSGVSGGIDCPTDYICCEPE